MATALLTLVARAVLASAQSVITPSTPKELDMDLVAALPTAVLARIASFADGDYVPSMYPAPPQLPARLFRVLSATSLRPAIRELEHDFHASVVHFELDADDLARCDAVEARLIEQLTQRRGRVQCVELGLEMLEYRRNFEVVKARAFAETLDTVTIAWDRVFALCPKLRRLDLSGFPLRSSQLPLVLRAASRHCRALQSLVLPDKEWYRGPVGMDALVVMQTLYVALKQWHKHSGGLRQLTIPQRTTHLNGLTTRQALADELLLAVAAYCPNLEHLDGWKVSLRETDGVLRCDERIPCSLDVWQMFCQSCTQIQELQWCLFPFTDAYFLTLAATPRPHLRKLTLATNASSFRGANDFEEDEPRECAASSVYQAIAACPALQELSILLQEEVVERGRAPVETTVSDTLLETLVTHCPQLERLEIRQADSGGGTMFTRDYRNDGITNRGLARLAALPELRSLYVNVGSHISADGLFALVANAPRVGRAREIELVVGSYDASVFSRGPAARQKHSVQFHAVLLEFFQLLIVHKGALEGRRFTLRLHNGSSLYVDDETAWQCELEATVAQLSVHCPQLQLHIVRQGGIAGATLRQSRDTRGSVTGIRTTRSVRCGVTSAAPWSTLAWYATMQAVALTAVYSMRTPARPA